MPNPQYTYQRHAHLAQQHSTGLIALVGKKSTTNPSPPTKSNQSLCRLAHSALASKTTLKYYACADGRIGLRDAVPRSVSAPIPAVAGAESPYGTAPRHISSLLLRMSPVELFAGPTCAVLGVDLPCAMCISSCSFFHPVLDHHDFVKAAARSAQHTAHRKGASLLLFCFLHPVKRQMDAPL